MRKNRNHSTDRRSAYHHLAHNTPPRHPPETYAGCGRASSVPRLLAAAGDIAQWPRRNAEIGDVKIDTPKHSCSP